MVELFRHTQVIAEIVGADLHDVDSIDRTDGGSVVDTGAALNHHSDEESLGILPEIGGGLEAIVRCTNAARGEPAQPPRRISAGSHHIAGFGGGGAVRRPDKLLAALQRG